MAKSPGNPSKTKTIRRENSKDGPRHPPLPPRDPSPKRRSKRSKQNRDVITFLPPHLTNRCCFHRFRTWKRWFAWNRPRIRSCECYCCWGRSRCGGFRRKGRTTSRRGGHRGSWRRFRSRVWWAIERRERWRGRIRGTWRAAWFLLSSVVEAGNAFFSNETYIWINVEMKTSLRRLRFRCLWSSLFWYELIAFTMNVVIAEWINGLTVIIDFERDEIRRSYVRIQSALRQKNPSWAITCKKVLFFRDATSIPATRKASSRKLPPSSCCREWCEREKWWTKQKKERWRSDENLCEHHRSQNAFLSSQCVTAKNVNFYEGCQYTWCLSKLEPRLQTLSDVVWVRMVLSTYDVVLLRPRVIRWKLRNRFVMWYIISSLIA